jgi:hypothetical protein
VLLWVDTGLCNIFVERQIYIPIKFNRQRWCVDGGSGLSKHTMEIDIVALDVSDLLDNKRN